MDPIQAPDDTKVDIQLKEILTEFVSRDGKDWDSILKRKPYSENGISYFKFKDFWLYLIRTKSWSEKTYPKNKTIRLLEDLFKAKQEVKKISDKSVKVWSVEKIAVEKYIPVKIKKEPAPFE
jgi:hypothetical protein